MTSSMPTKVNTRFLILSDTHGEMLMHPVTTTADVVIHCGDLTEESKLEEYRSAMQMLKSLNAPLKLVIAGNHDFSLDDSVFQAHLAEIRETIDDDQLLDSIYGKVGEARAFFEAEDATKAGIVFLDEGVHHFSLGNGAHLTIYASPYTASKSKGWGFQYDPDRQNHEWNMTASVDVVMTHSPPRGILDYTDSRSRAGITTLFEAVARAKPQLHCFGHIHEAWGAKLVTWREHLSDPPSHFTDIDNDNSRPIDSRSRLNKGRYDTPDVIAEKIKRRQAYETLGYREIENDAIRQSKETLFINAAIEGVEECQQQLPWVLNLNLPQQQTTPTKEYRRKRIPSTATDEAEAWRKKVKCTD